MANFYKKFTRSRLGTPSGGRKHSNKVKKLMSEYRKGISNNLYGKKHSTETVDTMEKYGIK